MDKWSREGKGWILEELREERTLYIDSQRTHENFTERSKANVVYKVSEWYLL